MRKLPGKFLFVCIRKISSCSICLASTFIQFVKEFRCTKKHGYIIFYMHHILKEKLKMYDKYFANV